MRMLMRLLSPMLAMPGNTRGKKTSHLLAPVGKLDHNTGTITLDTTNQRTALRTARHGLAKPAAAAAATEVEAVGWVVVEEVSASQPNAAAVVRTTEAVVEAEAGREVSIIAGAEVVIGVEAAEAVVEDEAGIGV